jgi:hypothetical protein
MYTPPEDKTTGRIYFVLGIAILVWAVYCITLL